MRIVGGRFKGAALAGPRGGGTRPTSDRLRESIFNILAHRFDDPVTGSRVLDLFAGTGALGLEAISRGAASCLFVDDAIEPRGLMRRNIETLDLTGVTKIFRRDATKLGYAGTIPSFDLVFLDPPYGRGLGEKALAAAHSGQWLQPGALCVLEEDAKSDITIPAGFDLTDQRTSGDSKVLFLKLS
ncbi:MAG: 16S rRNA (guanine(966)-N(2))-methyltransferase RsmD [Phycisphaerales bacterium]|nr:16S rRNA (guanine(966)-N(2))-methyltransferase RsmD [Phycisphaerales bacterium]